MKPDSKYIWRTGAAHYHQAAGSVAAAGPSPPQPGGTAANPFDAEQYDDGEDGDDDDDETG